MDGTAYAFTKLSLPNKGITLITELITEYPNLRQIDFSSNSITEISHLQKLKYPTNINLSRNLISDGRFLSNPSIFSFLKSMNLSNNKLKSLPAI
jgi:Leucine-rich repeat (LRR) protein